MKKTTVFTTVLLLILFFIKIAAAEAPALFFSDITSGPKTGLGDGVGQGAIVSIWGTGLGGSQGSSKIYIGGVEAVYVYYWGPADGSAMAGPAKLYESHRMQTISFSIPSGTPDGATSIYVVVNGQPSNILPFTVRSGNIYFVKTSGNNNTGDGSWTNPWQTLDYIGNRAGRNINTGDIIYVANGVQEADGFDIGVTNRDIDGIADKPISVVAYPGALVLAQGIFGIRNYNADSEYWNFAKLVVKTQTTGIYTFKGMRAVGNEITNYPGGCADGQSGAISGNNMPGKDTVGGIKALGNYIHDFGCDSTSKLHHTFYISNRGGFSAESFELGWNHLADNKAPYGLHVYDEGVCGDFTGTMRIHNNVVVNQRGVGIDIVTGGTTDPCFSMDVEVYNNLLNNVGLNYSWGVAVYVGGSNNKSKIKFYNNTINGYSDSSASIQGALAIGGITTFAGTWEWRNNIVVDTKNMPYYNSSYQKVTPSAVSNNIWYNGGDGNPSSPPSWDSNPVTLDPLFSNSTNNDFHLQSTSPAIDLGFNASPVVIRDLDGNLRPQGAGYDIGAYEYVSSQIPYLLGDVNADSQVDILDIQAQVNHILGIQDYGVSADVNGDGNVDVLDVQSVVNIILGG